jgi:hypothetical protein
VELNKRSVVVVSPSPNQVEEGSMIVRDWPGSATTGIFVIVQNNRTGSRSDMKNLLWMNDEYGSSDVTVTATLELTGDGCGERRSTEYAGRDEPGINRS